MLYFIGITITVFLSFLLITKKKKSNADKILAIWLFIIALHLTLFALVFTNKFLEFPYLLGLEIPLPLLHGPFLYLYTTVLTSSKALKSRSLLHFMPYGVCLLAFIPFFLSDHQDKILAYQNDGEAYFVLMAISFSSILLSGITYILLSLFRLYQYSKRIVEEYSYLEKINLKWLSYLILGMGFIWVIVIFAGDELIFTSVVLYTIFIGYYGIKQVGIFTNEQVVVKAEKVLEPTVEIITEKPLPLVEEKYKNSALSETELENIHQSLVMLMESEKAYKTPELSLSDIATVLKVHANSLSQVINRVEDKNFFDYINTLRVEEFKRLVTQPEKQQFTLLSIAYECGFNSKTSFNRNFKKVSGISPSKYLKEVKNSTL